MKDYYVYAHKKPDGKIFYVGKGRGIRQHQSGNRSEYWKRIVRKHGYISVILEKNLSETDSFEKEIFWIKFYKDKEQADANFTNGGDGVRVEKRWWNEAISKAQRGRKAHRGEKSGSYKDNISPQELRHLYMVKTMSSIEIAKKCGLSYTTIITRLRKYGIPVRNSGKKMIRIKCITDGEEFASINDAAKYYKLFRENIRKVLNGKYTHVGGKVFIHVPDDREACRCAF